MSYRLQSQTTLAEEIRRIAYEQIDEALVWLNRPRLSPDKAIHLRLLRPIWPALLATLADELHDLANKLGAHHDLVVLQAHVTEQPVHSQAAPQLLFGLINEECQALEAQALTAGRRLYAEKPEPYVARLGTYWASWQAEGEDHDS